VDTWFEVMPIKAGPVLGRINKGSRFIGAGMSASSIYRVVVQYAAQLGVKFTPHDLRRTYGKLAHKGRARIEQIQLSRDSSGVPKKYSVIVAALEHVAQAASKPTKHSGVSYFHCFVVMHWMKRVKAYLPSSLRMVEQV
jgi:hypothetical protein